VTGSVVAVNDGAPPTRDTTIDRLVLLEGTRNFRDLGGYRTDDGASVRWGRVYRSDHHGELTDGDLDRMHRLGVRGVIDLRGAAEVKRAPSKVDGDDRFEYRRLPVTDGGLGYEALIGRMRSGEVASIGAEDMIGFYQKLLEGVAEVFGVVLDRIAEPSDHAVVFHCTAGKDRTGLGAALFLAAVGVDDRQILDDYELTNRYRAGRRVEQLRPELAADGIDIDRFLPLFTAQRAVLEGALAGVRARHGSILGYLTGPAGLTAHRIEALREHLLER
jgi:protein-tyrosine phosphatase